MTGEELKWAWDNEVPIVTGGIVYLKISEIIYFKDRYGARRVAALCVDRFRSNSCTRALASDIEFAERRDRERWEAEKINIQSEAVS